MQTFEYKVKIEAENSEEAKKILSAMFDLMKTVKSEVSSKDFVEMASKIKANPKLVKQAMMFL